ncbi:MAG TPA: glycosyltransferase family 4 protein [Candidatus Limnocylindrales bacterium]|jgi:glycosyltransferase involved in cell wall biosynthesis
MVPVPPVAYGGTERIVGTLAAELSRRGHVVTLFASADSRAPCALEPIAPQSLWAAGYRGDVSAFLLSAVAQAWEQAERFDIIHSHVEAFGFLLARHCPTPVLSTLHGRLDRDGMPELLDRFSDIPLVAVSNSQRRWAPRANWVATVHHGLALAQMPFADDPGEYLLVVGRAAPEKGVAEAIELARRVGLPLKMVLKVHDPAEMELFERVVRPAVDEGVVDFLGELPPAERDPLYAGARATLMLGSWPEPFGLVAIESLASGTPVIARRAGALPEIVEHGADGYLVEDLSEAELAVPLVSALHRADIRQRALQRFSAARMADDYERIYRRLLRGSAESSVRVPATAS